MKIKVKTNDVAANVKQAEFDFDFYGDAVSAEDKLKTAITKFGLERVLELFEDAAVVFLQGKVRPGLVNNMPLDEIQRLLNEEGLNKGKGGGVGISREQRILNAISKGTMTAEEALANLEKQKQLILAATAKE